MLSFLLGLALLHGSLANDVNIVSRDSTVLSFTPSSSATGTATLVWTIGQNNTAVSLTNYVAMGFQNGVAANTATSDLSMFGPVGGGTEFFFMYGNSTWATGLHQHLNNSQRSGGRGGRPVEIQRLSTMDSTPPSADRIRDVAVTTSGANTVYTMTISCATRFWTDGAQPSAVLFAFGTVDGAGVPQRHAGNAMGRTFRRQTTSNTGDLLLFTLCGPSAGVVNPAPTTQPPTTGTSKAVTLNATSVFSVLFMVLACRLFVQ